MAGRLSDFQPANHHAPRRRRVNRGRGLAVRRLGRRWLVDKVWRLVPALGVRSGGNPSFAIAKANGEVAPIAAVRRDERNRRGRPTAAAPG
jgi:hypothetical protein